MQNEPINEESIRNQPSIDALQPKITKKKNWLLIIIVVSILVLLAIIFNDSEFVGIFAVVSIPFVIFYLASRNTYKEISIYKMITRPTFYLLLFVLNIVIFFVMIAFYGPGPGLLPISILIIVGEIIFDILAIIFYELILRYKIRTGKIK